MVVHKSCLPIFTVSINLQTCKSCALLRKKLKIKGMLHGTKSNLLRMGHSPGNRDNDEASGPSLKIVLSDSLRSNGATPASGKTLSLGMFL